MSGLIERIVRRRRASASSRLGPPSLNGGAPAYRPHANGAPPGTGPACVNGAEAVEVPAVEPPIEAEARPLVDPESAAPPVEAQAQAPPAVEPDPATTPAVEPNPATHPAVQLDPATPPPPEPEPSFRERGRMRRRARYLRRLRELQMRDIGGFVLELHRFHRDRPDLVEAKVEWAAQTDRELRALDRALGTSQPLGELREAGIGGACLNCGAVHGSLDRYCATCGEPLEDSGAPATWRTGEFPKLQPPAAEPE